uniref:Uncharacterized protein n=1 Tax=Cannabis sativa TaxID=3483 RepID=A0A803QRX1_CANSA
FVPAFGSQVLLLVPFRFGTVCPVWVRPLLWFGSKDWSQIYTDYAALSKPR